jgi:hypothetical protein
MNADMVAPGLVGVVIGGVELVIMFGVVYFAARLAIRHERRE